MKKQNLIAFAIALFVMFSIAVVSTGFMPVASAANPTSQSLKNKSAPTDSTVADFSFSDEAKKQAATNFIPLDAVQKSGFITKQPGQQFQINYPEFTNASLERYYDLEQIKGNKFEIVPNWRSCKADTYFFMSDYKPELVWRE